MTGAVRRLVSVNVRVGGAVSCEPGSAARVPTPGPVELDRHGLVGEAPADPQAPGALAEALLAYPSEHYPFWRTVRAQARVAAWGAELLPGSLGEQLTIAGLHENEVWIGDVLRFADVELAVSAPRLPTAGLDARLGFPHAAALMRANGWSGFFLAVRRPGTLSAGEAFELVPGPRELLVSELFRARVPAGRRE